MGVKNDCSWNVKRCFLLCKKELATRHGIPLQMSANGVARRIWNMFQIFKMIFPLKADECGTRRSKNR